MKRISRKLLALMLALALCLAPAPAAWAEEAGPDEPNVLERPEYLPVNEEQNPFEDVTEGDYYYPAVLWALEQGITTGTSETAFSPDGACTRAQVVTFLWRLAGKPVPHGVNTFTDVEEDSWYEQAVLWAIGEGITNGTSQSTFTPNGRATRAQVITLLYRMMGEPAAAGELNYKDVTEQDWFGKAVLWAEENSVLDRNNTPDATHFEPNLICRRADIVTFLQLADQADAAAPVYAHQYVGMWMDRTSGRASLTILPQTEQGYGDYVITLRWGSSAWESRVWEFYAIFQEDTGRMFYANGETADIVSGNNGEVEKTVIYDDNQGSFYFKYGMLRWEDNHEDRSGEMFFEPVFTSAPTAEEFADGFFREVGGYLAGTSGASLREAAAVCRALSFAVEHEFWTIDVPAMRSAMLAAWESLTEEERAAFDANWMSVAQMADQAFRDYDSVKDLFSDAGVEETMAGTLTVPGAALSWDCLKSNTFTLGNSEE